RCRRGKLQASFSVFLIPWRIRIIAWCYSVLASNLSIPTLYDEFTATGILQHLFSLLGRSRLCLMQACCTLRIGLLIHPSSIWPLIYNPIVLAHVRHSSQP